MREIVLMVVIIAGGSSVTLSQTKSMASAAAAPCNAARLKVTHGEADRAMGGVNVENYTITNTGASPCSLRGFPSVQLLDAHGRPRHAAKASNDLAGLTMQPSQTVTLAANGPAWFGVFFNSGGAGRVGPPCPTFRKVRLTLPHTKHPFVLSDEIEYCADLQVSAIQSGSPPH
jgi:hypothetical protein